MLLGGERERGGRERGRGGGGRGGGERGERERDTYAVLPFSLVETVNLLRGCAMFSRSSSFMS